MTQVQGVEVFRVALPRGRRLHSFMVRLTGDGDTGWGEVTAADADSCWTDLEERVGPALLGLDWERPEQVAGIAELGCRPATAAVETACWDLWCRQHRVPLADALGGTRTSIVAGVRVVAYPEIDTLLTHVNRRVSAGYARVTLTISPGWDIEPVRAVRHAFPALAVQVDAGGSYSEDPDHLAALVALDAYGLLAIERPFRSGDLAAHVLLQGKVDTPVSPEITDLDTLEAAVTMDAGRAVCLRTASIGGLTAARTLHDRAHAAGWQVWCDGGPGFGIGHAAAVAVASLPGCTLPSDVTETLAGVEVVSPPVRASGGLVAVPLTQPGLGHDVDTDLIGRLATQTLRIPPSTHLPS